LEAKYTLRNNTNHIVNCIYRNLPLNVTGKDEPDFDSVINKVQSTVHAYTKYMSSPPEIHIPVYNPTKNSLGKAARRKRILEAWLRENKFAIKWLTMVRSCSMFGYQGMHLGLTPELDTKFAIVLDDPNHCYSIPKSYDDCQLDLYCVKKVISGKQIYDALLGGGKPYGDDKRKQPRAGLAIEDDVEKLYEIIIVWDDTYTYTIDLSTSTMLGKTMYHGLGEPPAVMLKNFVNPGYSEGISDVAHVLAINHYLNTMLTNMADVMSYQANPIAKATKVPANLDLSKMISEQGIVVFEDEKSDFSFVTHPGVPRESFSLYDMVEDSSEQQTSMTKLASSGHSGARKIDSGPAVSSLNIGVEAMLNLKKIMMSTLLSTFFGMYLRRIDAVYQPEIYGEAANIQVGSEDSDSSFTFNADSIKGAYDVDVVFVEGIFDMATRKQMALTEFDKNLISKRTYRRMTNLRVGEDEDKLIALEREQEIQYEARLKAAQDGQLPVEQGSENPNAISGPNPIEQDIEQAMSGGMGQGMGQPMGGMGMGQQGGGMGMGGMGQGGLPAMEAGAMGGDISEDVMNPGAGMDEEELATKIENIAGLSGEAVLVGIQGETITIALEVMNDQPKVIKALPEYAGQIKFISMSNSKT